MIRQLLILLIVVTGAAGCKSKRSSSASGGADDVGTMPTYPTEPPTETRKWTQAEVTTWLHETLGLTDVVLTATGNHGFAGTGKGEGGAVWKLKVIQKPGEISCEFEHPAPTAPGLTTTGKVDFKK